jgi:hypothetical protein
MPTLSAAHTPRLQLDLHYSHSFCTYLTKNEQQMPAYSQGIAAGSIITVETMSQNAR